MTTRNFAVPANMSTRRQILLGAAITAGGLAIAPANMFAEIQDGISHTSESIHQEPIFKASPMRVYQALTDSAQFNKVTLLSEAARSGMLPGNTPTEISSDVGGAFVLFGGYVTGRHLELTPNARIVQAWRSGSWKPGAYSIVSFQLMQEGPATRIIFDHGGFPQGQAQHLAHGWKGNYWDPMEKYLAQA